MGQGCFGQLSSCHRVGQNAPPPPKKNITAPLPERLDYFCTSVRTLWLHTESCRELRLDARKGRGHSVAGVEWPRGRAPPGLPEGVVQDLILGALRGAGLQPRQQHLQAVPLLHSRHERLDGAHGAHRHDQVLAVVLLRVAPVPRPKPKKNQPSVISPLAHFERFTCLGLNPNVIALTSARQYSFLQSLSKSSLILKAVKIIEKNIKNVLSWIGMEMIDCGLRTPQTLPIAPTERLATQEGGSHPRFPRAGDGRSPEGPR